jgi:HSP20 family protein
MSNLRLWSEQELARMRNDVERLFEDLRNDLGLAGRTCPGLARIHVIEEPEALLVRVEAPGCCAGDLEILLEDQQLSIAFQHSEQGRNSRRTTAARQRLRLPRRVDVDRAEARLSEGVLYIRMPKQASPRTRRLNVISD